MKNIHPNLIIVFILTFFIAGFLVYQYVFSIYEITYSVEPAKLFSDNQSTVTIKVTPVNSFGWKSPFRAAKAQFEFTEGKELVDVVFKNSDEIILRANNKTGKVVVLIKSKYSLFPSSIEIMIYPNSA